jgi:hypothetical protein
MIKTKQTLAASAMILTCLTDIQAMNNFDPVAEAQRNQQIGDQIASAVSTIGYDKVQGIRTLLLAGDVKGRHAWEKTRGVARECLKDNLPDLLQAIFNIDGMNKLMNLDFVRECAALAKSSNYAKQNLFCVVQTLPLFIAALSTYNLNKKEINEFSKLAYSIYLVIRSIAVIMYDEKDVEFSWISPLIFQAQKIAQLNGDTDTIYTLRQMVYTMEKSVGINNKSRFFTKIYMWLKELPALQPIFLKTLHELIEPIR